MKNYYKCDVCEEWHNADYDEFIKEMTYNDYDKRVAEDDKKPLISRCGVQFSKHFPFLLLEFGHIERAKAKMDELYLQLKERLNSEKLVAVFEFSQALARSDFIILMRRKENKRLCFNELNTLNYTLHMSNEVAHEAIAAGFDIEGSRRILQRWDSRKKTFNALENGDEWENVSVGFNVQIGCKPVWFPGDAIYQFPTSVRLTDSREAIEFYVRVGVDEYVKYLEVDVSNVSRLYPLGIATDQLSLIESHPMQAEIRFVYQYGDQVPNFFVRLPFRRANSVVVYDCKHYVPVYAKSIKTRIREYQQRVDKLTESIKNAYDESTIDRKGHKYTINARDFHTNFGMNKKQQIKRRQKR